MATPTDPGSETLKGALPLMETPTTEIIVAGGPSSSTNLNRLRTALLADIAELDRRVADNQAAIQSANTVLTVQSAALSTALQSLSAQLPSTSGRWLADGFTRAYIDATTSADVNTTYGQATLPVLSSQEKLVGEDSRGQVWIPKGAQLAYSYQSAAPDEVNWLADDRSVNALDQRQDTAWWRTRETSGTVWVRVQLPPNLNANKLANTIILHPYPVLAYDLVSVEYRDPAGVWTAADLSYLEGYSAATTRVQAYGNVRLFIPQSPVTEVRLKLLTAAMWGFSKLSVRQTEFQPAATLTVDFMSFSPGTLGSAVVYGKDQDALAYLTTQINGNLVSVALTQNAANSSPVITGVEARS